MDVREKLVEQAISHFWYGISHDIFSEPVTTYAKLAIEALKKDNGVTVQSGIDANTYQLMRECERLKEEKESLSNAVNVLEEINSDLYKQIKGITVQECGHWEDDHGDYVCSCCHTVFTDDLVWLVRGESNEPNYCPNCGANMMPQPPKGE